jgi:pyruvate ferredoxin oxidoreductase beta subunit/2-oxoisovalerate ferredoxin oxidoreductase beta subunit
MFWDVTTVEYLNRGHMACPGCIAALSMRHFLKISGEKTIVVIPASCWSIISGMFPTTALSVPLLHTPFATAAATASGIKRALKVQGKGDVNVIVWAGDGGTFDIGLQALSGAAERNEDFIYICYDNEAYMNTGAQQSSATPPGAWTATTPAGKDIHNEKKDLIGIVKAHNPSYIASATIAYPDDFYIKVNKALKKRGFRFLHLLCACPPGWRIESQDALSVCRYAVESEIFPLIELGDDNKMHKTYIPETPLPLEVYLKSQKRFAKISSEDIEILKKRLSIRNMQYTD